MVRKDKTYRFLLSQELFEKAKKKAERQDINLAQVLRRFLSAWVAGEIELPPYHGVTEED